MTISEIVILLGKLVPVVLGIVGALIFYSPEKLPRFVASRRYLYRLSVSVIYVIAAFAFGSAVVALVSVVGDFREFLSRPNSNESTLTSGSEGERPISLPPIKVPPIANLPPGPDQRGGTLTSLRIAGVHLGMDLTEAIRVVREQLDNCTEIEVEDRAWTGISVTVARLDPVFQSPRVIECYRDPKDYEHVYLFPNIYEDEQRVFAIVRVGNLPNLRPKDIQDLLVARYGIPIEPSYQPNYGTHLYWVADSSLADPTKINEECFLYLPRALKSSLDGAPVGAKVRSTSRAQLSSHELDTNCGVTLTTFISDERRFWMLLVDTERVMRYKTYARDKAAAEEAERINKARQQTRF